MIDLTDRPKRLKFVDDLLEAFSSHLV